MMLMIEISNDEIFRAESPPVCRHWLILRWERHAQEVKKERPLGGPGSHTLEGAAPLPHPSRTRTKTKAAYLRWGRSGF